MCGYIKTGPLCFKGRLRKGRFSMRINTYQTKLDEDRVIALVRETSKNYPEVVSIESPEHCAKLIESAFDASNLSEERLWLVALNGARRVAGLFEVSHGTLMSSLVHPREIFVRAILSGAASIIIVHNHPSGMLDISEQDREVSRRIRQAGELLGIRLDDHVIVAGGNFVSAA